MSATQKSLLLGVGLAVLLGAGMYLLWGREAFPISQWGLGATTTVNGVSGTGSFTVEQVKAEPPSPDRPITITANLPQDAKEILTKLLEEQISILKKEPTRMDIWLRYGTNRKIAGDYEAAVEAWEYVALAAPKELSATAHGNLGDLYLYFLKEYEKADVRYNQAITLNPNVIEYYRALFYLYKDIYKDKTKAGAILVQGLKANPGNTDLLRYQSELNAS